MDYDMITLQQKEEEAKAHPPADATEKAISTVVKTAQGLKDHFLKISQPLIDEYVNAAMGKGELSSNNTHCREEVWDVLKKLMLQSSEKLEIMEGGSPEAIISAVEQGKCTVAEGKELLGMYKQLRDIKDPTGKGSGMALQININGVGSDADVIEVGGE